MTAFPVKLARQAVETFINSGAVIDLPAEVPPEFLKPAGSFVSLKIKGKLRGCIGTVKPYRPTVSEEIIYNAISSATKDPRFSPVSKEELEFLNYSVDILTPEEKVDSISELDPKRYGVIVRSAKRAGLLLPAIPGVDTAEEQIAIAKQKAGLTANDKVELYRFEVTRFQE
jgi:AmmeMemoRadiSam system protein A